MTRCTHCGHEQGDGAFCAGCGRRVLDLDWRTGTAERPRVEVDDPSAEPSASSEQPATVAEEPSVPPPSAVPPAARYPLYADDPAATSVLPAPRPEPEPEPAPIVPGVAFAEPGSQVPASAARGRRGVVPWVVGGVVVLALGGVGAALLLAGGSEDERATDPVAAEPTTSAPTTTSPTPAPTRPTLASPSRTPKPAPDPTDVVADAEVSTPETAEPGVSVAGDPVSFAAGNLLDGRPDTAWRTPGDASGETITLRLAQPTVVSAVGMINGYAKSEAGYDGYTANRRVTAAEWSFDDGTSVSQPLGESRSMQVVDVPDVRTRTVTLTMRTVSAPGQTDGRNFTAISDLAVVGVPKKR